MQTPNPILQYFEWSHLPKDLQPVSALFCDLAAQLENSLPNCAEKSAAMRKLLEAKDCAVRARLFKENW